MRTWILAELSMNIWAHNKNAVKLSTFKPQRGASGIWNVQDIQQQQNITGKWFHLDIYVAFLLVSLMHVLTTVYISNIAHLLNHRDQCEQFTGTKWNEIISNDMILGRLLKWYLKQHNGTYKQPVLSDLQRLENNTLILCCPFLPLWLIAAICCIGHSNWII